METFWAMVLGSCKLRWFIFGECSTPQKVKMVVYYDIINLMGNYMVVNKLKSSYKNSHALYYML
jgi:hypothetical protein